MIGGQNIMNIMSINISGIKISYFCSLRKYLQIFHGVHIGGKHKVHVVQVNNKKDNLKKIIFFN
jgi:hypothetical protein